MNDIDPIEIAQLEAVTRHLVSALEMAYHGQEAKAVGRAQYALANWNKIEEARSQLEAIIDKAVGGEHEHD